MTAEGSEGNKNMFRKLEEEDSHYTVTKIITKSFSADMWKELSGYTLRRFLGDDDAAGLFLLLT